MDNNKFMLVSLDDDSKSKSVAEVLSSPTCKKVINYLAENKEASQKDISQKLGIPMNTLDYNMKKLLSSGFVQKRKNFFWSKKGKKIVMYELSNKSILISHKKKTSDKIKSITPAIILVAAGTFAVWVYDKVISQVSRTKDVTMGVGVTTPTVVSNAGSTTVSQTAVNHAANIITSQSTWEWFLLGGLIAIFIISVINWRKL
jgi:DNA-binding MarR family transcriptional regulator